MIKVLIGCEASGTITKAFRELGIDAWSCDLIDTYGSLPQYHIKDDILKVINYDNWDLLIAHPPCTYLALSGSCNIKKSKFDRIAAGQDALEFFKKLLNCNIPHRCIENPKMYGYFLKQIPYHDQVIQPYYFGDPFSKYTCLWLRNLPPLDMTCLFPIEIISWTDLHRDAKLRSKTFDGVAAAMANQWSNYLC